MFHAIILSTWDENKYRKNEYIDSVWKDCYKLNQEHFYHVGAREKNRGSMLEALLMNYEPLTAQDQKKVEYEQLSFVLPGMKQVGRMCNLQMEEYGMNLIL